MGVVCRPPTATYYIASGRLFNEAVEWIQDLLKSQGDHIGPKFISGYYFQCLANEACTIVLALVTAEMELKTSRIPVSHFLTLPDVLSYSHF